jgi:predicted nucleic acid-binding protein
LIVADASFLLEVLLNGSVNERAAAAIESAGLICAPQLVDYEVMSGIRRQVLAKRLTPPIALETLALFRMIRIERYPMMLYASRIWELHRNISIYDAAYVALAEHLDASLYTRDRKLAAAPNHKARIVMV